MSHFDAEGRSRMVDVGQKPITVRMARATGEVYLLEATLDRIRRRDLSKGDVLEVARLAGIMGAKRTSELIPLCHPLPLDAVTIDFAFPDAGTLAIEAQVQCTAKTGVEMEALTAVCVAALTVYDMCKSIDREMQIGAVRLEEKSGGRSGHFVRGQGTGSGGHGTGAKDQEAK
ncbi:MAG TPA: cyclic pyranopterin monophosphate synthase MoaC [Pirellulales bacterium]|jgi:cyclic pyranopterin phosphate synthase|nr:cyclic pyranopterin monophosphate synthase MoaC [Pirellulales bacterium]